MARSEFVGSITFYGPARIMVSVTTLDESFLKSVTRNFSFSAYVRAGVQFSRCFLGPPQRRAWRTPWCVLSVREFDSKRVIRGQRQPLKRGYLRTQTGILGKRRQLSSRTIAAIYRAG